ncbi:MAG TPA: dTDP-glucose 4,6-dehydratase [Aggregatilineales bacterium]|nr:dTDP-glucose 4,6-dehydratase [Anaerolineales bacterium]HRE47669.1 dTDP-glucose 4,6-dehydratase [Aggregatilineales bacterium]
MKTILVTGGAGFIGSAFVRHMVATYPHYRIIVLDKLTYAGNMDNLLPVSDEENYAFRRGDIADHATVRHILATDGIDTIVNFAAESHVDRSILDPDAFIKTDVVGVYVLLEEARKAGIQRFHHVSTDEVYGSIPEGFFKEGDPLEPNSPYSASKAGGEMMIRAYHVTYGMTTTITRGSNTYGEYQYPEKMLPLFITEAIDDRPLPVYGDGMQVRDWLHVDDHCRAIDLVLHKGTPGEIYNVGGENERHNLEVTKRVLSLLGKPETLIRYVTDRPGHDRRYALTCEKIRGLGWRQSASFEELLEKTVRWYQANEWWWRKIKTGEYLAYYKQQYADRLANAAQG